MAIKITIQPQDDALNDLVLTSNDDPALVTVSVGAYGTDTIVPVEQLLATLEGLVSLTNPKKRG